MIYIEIKQQLVCEIVGEFISTILLQAKNTKDFKELLHTIDNSFLRDYYCLYGEPYNRNRILEKELYNARFKCEKLDKQYNSKKYIVKMGDLLVNHFGYHIIKPDGFYKINYEFVDKAMKDG